MKKQTSKKSVKNKAVVKKTLARKVKTPASKIKAVEAKSTVKEQVLPIVFTVITAAFLIAVIYLEIITLNIFTPTDILTKIQLSDILIGLTIYLKTSVDFAIFIGNLMASYHGWKNRISIEIGTAVGNALGTVIILAIWDFFKEIKLLLAAMILIAALVLLKLAEESLSHVKDQEVGAKERLLTIAKRIETVLSPINKFLHGGLKYIMPNLSMKPKLNLTFWGLLATSFTIPFILGLDDFAGYVPVFNIVNVFGFSIGVIVGHMILNIFLFISPANTIKAVKNPVVSVLGSLAFIGLAIWGFYEVFNILFLGH
ncbi:MAG TPA: hypothetical protein VM077_04480 [Candidatus Limnocylindrales bacterium]|nr:hypothetical protein [Candidatus Limnocylindrales bacterium]